VIAFQRILCPIDFSEGATRALVCAAALARGYEARLTVLHVVPVFADSMEPGFPWRGEVQPMTVAPARADLVEQMRRSIAEAGAGGLQPELVAEEGLTHPAIIQRATSMQADLLVLGTHGRGGINRLLLGSITEKVVRTAPCPVLTVPPAARGADAPQAVFKNILCPVDFAPSSLKALEYALDLGRQADGCVTIFHAVEHRYSEELWDDGDPGPPWDREQVMARARARVHELATRQEQTWCRIEEQVVDGRPYKATLQYAAAHGIDLIVMGAQGRGGVELMLYGSNTHHVVRAAACPVLTVRA